jgi:hypothetical protein
MKSARGELEDFRADHNPTPEEELNWALARINDLKDAPQPRVKHVIFTRRPSSTFCPRLEEGIREATQAGMVMAWVVSIGEGLMVATFVGAESVWIRR